jgi:hypothetical protein
LLYRNLGDGRFDDISASLGPDFAALHSSRGAAAADIRNDGALAIAVNEIHEPPSLLAPAAPSPNHWIGVRAVGTKSNRDGIGARIEIQAGALRQIDEVRSGGSYLSQSDLRVHFGLGANARVDRLAIHWPSGAVDRFANVPADRHIVIEEGRGYRVGP